MFCPEFFIKRNCPDSDNVQNTQFITPFCINSRCDCYFFSTALSAYELWRYNGTKLRTIISVTARSWFSAKPELVIVRQLLNPSFTNSTSRAKSKTVNRWQSVFSERELTFSRLRSLLCTKYNRFIADRRRSSNLFLISDPLLRFKTRANRKNGTLFGVSPIVSE